MLSFIFASGRKGYASARMLNVSARISYASADKGFASAHKAFASAHKAFASADKAFSIDVLSNSESYLAENVEQTSVCSTAVHFQMRRI